MLYYDCNCKIGQRPEKHRRTRWSTDHLLEDMDLAEIAGALVIHAAAESYDPCYGNERLQAELARAPQRLFGAWCILPLGSPDFYSSADELLRPMAKNNIRAVRAVTGNYSLHPDMMGATLAALQEAGVLLLLSASWATSGDLFSFFHEFLSAYPRLPVLLTDHTWSQQRYVHRLMQLHDNLNIEFSSYQINRGPERYVADFGDERLLFGTGGTEKSPGAARTYLDYAQIGEESRRRIAGGNLQRLLGGQGPVAEPVQRSGGDSCVDDCRAGLPQSVFVFDAHAHVLHEGGEAAGVNYVMHNGDAAGLLEVYDWCGIDRSAMMSWSGPVCSDAHEGNEIVHRAMERHGERVLGVAVIDPSHMSPAEMEAEMRLRHLEQGFVGMKPYPRMGLAYDDEAFTPWWRLGNDHRLYALIHTDTVTGGVAAVGRLAESFPEVSWIIAHSGASYAYAEEVAGCIQQHPNVFAEITLTPVTNGVIEYLVEATDDEHVLFGTDVPMRDPRQQLGWVLWADLPLDSKKKILGTNFQRIVERAVLPQREDA
jgi:predicted TIM-barrel fold metal-dependent hydrolase